jgi:hypothetical protein
MQQEQNIIRKEALNWYISLGSRVTGRQYHIQKNFGGNIPHPLTNEHILQMYLYRDLPSFAIPFRTFDKN